MADTSFVSGHYLARSWAMLTQDEGWWKPILVLALVSFIPFIGPIWVLGYILGWTRLTAWGIDSAPKQRNVNVVGCLSTGWTAFVVELGWMAVAWAVYWAFGAALPPLLIVVVVGFFFYNLLTLVAITRAAIYQRISPGYGLNQIFDMAGRDYGGLMSVIAIQLLELVICFGVLLVVTLIFVLALSGPIARIAGIAYYYGEEYLSPALLDLVLGSVAWAGPIMVFVGYIFSLITTTFQFLVYNAVALWIRQFDVPHWGGPHDPVPASIPPVSQTPWENAQGGEPVSPSNPVNPAQEPNDRPLYESDPTPPLASQPLEPQETPGAPDDVGEPVVPPSAEDLYDVATERTTEWTDVVSPTPNATFHMAWPEDGETHKPAKADEHGVKPPTAPALYTVASEHVAETWPDVDLQSNDATPSIDTPEVAEEVNRAVAQEAEREGEPIPEPEVAAPPKSEGPKPDVPQSPVTPPSPEDLYETATENTTHWVEVVNPPLPGTGSLQEPERGETLNPPAVKDGGGVNPPTAPELYTTVASEVAKTWPDVDLQSRDAVASIDDGETKQAVDEAVEQLEEQSEEEE